MRNSHNISYRYCHIVTVYCGIPAFCNILLIEVCLFLSNYVILCITIMSIQGIAIERNFVTVKVLDSYKIF